MRDPKVIKPPGFDTQAAWQGCSAYVDKCGGMVHEDGEPNWRAAFGADPGCCSCPACGEMYWRWGTLVECLDCGFQFPTDWWAMYSWGVGSAKRAENPLPAASTKKFADYLERTHNERLSHPYYRYGFENPVEDAWEMHDKIPWKEIFPEANTQEIT